MDYVGITVADLQEILLNNGFIQHADALADAHAITPKGRIAAQLQELHPLAMADLYVNTDYLNRLNPSQLAGLFSCFYPLTVKDELRAHQCTDINLQDSVLYMKEKLDNYLRNEQTMYLITGANYEIAYDLLPYVIQWCASEDEITCKKIIQEVKLNVGVFIGEFIKALLKVNAIAQEMERVCENTHNMALLEKIRIIPSLTLKYIATNQSLYL
jgi:superfamily II RNA helicase